MKTVYFIQEYDDGERVYLAGQAREFDDKAADQLVKDGIAAEERPDEKPEKKAPKKAKG